MGWINLTLEILQQTEKIHQLSLSDVDRPAPTRGLKLKGSESIKTFHVRVLILYIESLMSVDVWKFMQRFRRDFYESINNEVFQHFLQMQNAYLILMFSSLEWVP